MRRSVGGFMVGMVGVESNDTLQLEQGCKPMIFVDVESRSNKNYGEISRQQF